jgi:hypothetical protein
MERIGEPAVPMRLSPRPCRTTISHAERPRPAPSPNRMPQRGKPNARAAILTSREVTLAHPRLFVGGYSAPRFLRTGSTPSPGPRTDRPWPPGARLRHGCAGIGIRWPAGWPDVRLSNASASMTKLTARPVSGHRPRSRGGRQHRQVIIVKGTDGRQGNIINSVIGRAVGKHQPHRRIRQIRLRLSG